MPTEIDSLQISIEAKATKANDAIDRLVGKLDRLSISMGRMNTSNLNGLANGVDKLGRAMQTMNAVKTADFTRLATNLAKLGNINVSALNSTASSLSNLAKEFNALGGVSSNALQVGDLAKNLGKLGGKSVTNAIANIPQLATSMNNLMTTLSKSPKVSQNIIDMTNALANLSSQGSRIKSATNVFSGGFRKTNSSMKSTSKSAWSLASAFGKFYASYFMVIRGVKGLWNSIKSTADYMEALNYYTVSFNKIGKEWSGDFEKYGYENAEAYAKSFTDRMSKSFSKLSGIQFDSEKGLLSDTGIKNLGMNIQEITQYGAQLASVTNSVGQTGEVSLAAAKSFTKLAGDMSSLFNQDYSSVMKNIQSGLIGQSRAMYKYGIDITNATLQTYAYELGLSKAVSEMTQAEKMQLRMIAILDQSKVSWGDLANTINSPSNMIRQFKTNLKESGIVLGQLFVPLLQKVMPVINGVTIAIKRLLTNIAGFLGIKLDANAFGQGMADLEEDSFDVSEGLDSATDSAKKLHKQLAGFDELENLSSGSDASGTSGTGSGGSIDLTQEILDATSEYERVWSEAYSNMENQAQEIADRIYGVFERGDYAFVGSLISSKIINALKKIDWESVYEGARGFGSGLAKFFNGLITPDLFGQVGSTIAGALNTVIESALSFGQEFDFDNLGNSLAKGLNNFFEDFKFKELAKGINTWVKGLIKSIISFMDNTDWSQIGKKIGEFISNINWGGITFDLLELGVSFAEALVNAIWSAIKSAPIESAIIGGLALMKFTGFGNELKTRLSKSINTAISGSTAKAGATLKGKLSNALGIAGTIAVGAGLTLELAKGLYDQLQENANSLKEMAETAIKQGLGDIDLGDNEFAISWNILFDDNAEEIQEKLKSGMILKTLTEVSDKFKSTLESYKNGVDDLNSSIMGSLGGWASAASIADKYFEMSKNYDSLTEEQKKTFQSYYDIMKTNIPEINKYVDGTTGAYKGTKDELNKLIEDTKKYYIVMAAKDALSKHYTMLFELDTKYKTLSETLDKKLNTKLGSTGKTFSQWIDSIKKSNPSLYKMLDNLRDAGYNLDNLTASQKEAIVTEMQNNDTLHDYIGTIGNIPAALEEVKSEIDETNKTIETETEIINTNGESWKGNTKIIDEEVDKQKNKILSLGTNYESLRKKAEEEAKKTGESAETIYNKYVASLEKIPPLGTSEMQLLKNEMTREAIETGKSTGNMVLDNTVMKLKDLGLKGPEIMALLDTSLKSQNNVGTDVGKTVGNNIANGIGSSLSSGKDLFKNSLMTAFNNAQIKLGLKTETNNKPDWKDFTLTKFDLGLYATGGFPEVGNLFIANEAGPELVGTIGGKTAVAPNGEITGIRDEIRSTANEEIALLRQQNALLQGILEKEFGISSDALFDSVRNSADSYTKRTGNLAFG